MHKKTLSSLLILPLLGVYTTTYGVTCGEVTPAISCNDVSGYELYTCRVKNICDQCRPEKIIFNTEKDGNQKYLELEPADELFLEENKKRYRDNMNDLYACALIQAQTNALNSITEERNAEIEVQDKIDARINDRINILEQTSEARGCANINKTEIFSKLDVLQQSSYEVCKYISYLDYLDYYSDNLGDIITEDGTKTQATQLQADIKNEISREFDNTLKIFPLAYTAYAQYENYIAIHFMLELIREDFIIFRKRLQEVLLPINQALYKAHNAMGLPD